MVCSIMDISIVVPNCSQVPFWPNSSSIFFLILLFAPDSLSHVMEVQQTMAFIFAEKCCVLEIPAVEAPKS